MIESGGRVAWVDYAKGFCIIMVVMMHSTLGVEKAAGEEGWLHAAVAFAAPFRMPDFFLISGLFLSRVIDRDWRNYLDRKVLHFAYFYLLWLTIQFAFKAPEFAVQHGIGEVGRLYLVSLIDPFGTIWFIYLLPIFFVVVKASQRVPWWLIWLAGAALEMAHLETGWVVIDEFAARFVYFYSGCVFAPMIFRFAEMVLERPRVAASYLGAWSLINGFAVFVGLSALPGVSLSLGLVGAVAVVTLSTLLSRADLMAQIRYCGRNSIVIYLAFFLPMAAARILLLKTATIPDIGTISVIVTVSGVILPLVLYWTVRATPLRFLFERPNAIRLRAIPTRLVPAE